MTDQAADAFPKLNATAVYIVLCNGEVDEVFDNAPAAELHCRNLTAKWNITQIVLKVLKSW